MNPEKYDFKNVRTRNVYDKAFDEVNALIADGWLITSVVPSGGWLEFLLARPKKEVA